MTVGPGTGEAPSDKGSTAASAAVEEAAGNGAQGLAAQPSSRIHRSRTHEARSRTHQPRVSRSEQLQQAIKDLIVQRGLSAGDPLPTELDLVDELDVSRNSLREALKALQAVGIVEIRHGFGMYVGRMSLGALVDGLAFHSRITMHNDHRDLINVINVREVLETGLVRRLVLDHPNSDHREVAEVVEQMEKEARAGFVEPETDRRFHQVLYRPLANPLVPQLLGAFWDVYFQLKDDIGPIIETAEEVALRHRDIYLAVLTGDADAAQAAMAAHFSGVRRRLDVRDPDATT